ncbi:MAG: toprim domain-containing protein [Holosporaceae bacterium]|nr:toprim domain-containing protein [Holosporaceae bacterium]
MTETILHEALRKYEIPEPQNVSQHGFTRWGRNSRYWAAVVGDGFIFGDFCFGLSESVFPQSNKQLSRKEIAQRRREIEKAVRESQRLREQQQIEAAERAKKMWSESTPVGNNDHPYLQKKKVFSYGLRAYGLHRSLVVPILDLNGEVSSLQFIDADGVKTFLCGARKKGCFYNVGNLAASRFFLCEGYATGATIREALGNETVIVCFDAGNLESVACALHTKYPDTDFTVCADNDFNRAGLVGAEKVLDSIKTVKINVVFPVFMDMFTNPTDFNDLANLEGLEAVRKQILGEDKHAR